MVGPGRFVTFEGTSPNRMALDIRWEQRLTNFRRAFAQLEKAVAQETYSDLERQGLIQCFEFTYELAWNTLKDFLEDQGYTGLTGAKDAIQTAFQVGLIADGPEWLRMHRSRNLTSHTYNERTALAIADAIRQTYANLFTALLATLETRRTNS